MEGVNWLVGTHLRSRLSAGAKRLLQDPGARFFGEAAPVAVERRRLSLRVHDLCFAHVFVAARYDVYVHDGMNRDLSIASAQKAAKTNVLCRGSLFKVFRLRVLAPKFQRHAQSHAHLAPRNMAGRLVASPLAYPAGAAAQP